MHYFRQEHAPVGTAKMICIIYIANSFHRYLLGRWNTIALMTTFRDIARKKARHIHKLHQLSQLLQLNV
jgi:hypothetical protein